MKAWEDVNKFINLGKPVNPEPTEDHYTFYMIYQSAEDNKAKWASIEMRKLALMITGQQQTAQENTTASQTQGQVVNNMLQSSQQPQTNTSLTM